MGYRWIQPTAEVELEFDAPTEDGVFHEALHALAELIRDDELGQVVRSSAVAGQRPCGPAGQWLGELVYRAETGDLCRRTSSASHGLRATARFHLRQPRQLVNGATYHRLAFQPAGGGFRARPWCSMSEHCRESRSTVRHRLPRRRSRAR